MNDRVNEIIEKIYQEHILNKLDDDGNRSVSLIENLIDMPENWGIEGYHDGWEVSIQIQLNLDYDVVSLMMKEIVDAGIDYDSYTVGFWYLEKKLREKLGAED